MSTYLRAGVIGLITVAASSGDPARAAINVSNHSFESPATTFVSFNIDSWQKSAKPEWYDETGGFLWIYQTGIFHNTPPGSLDHIDNCDGAQALWLFAVPEVGLFQDYDSIDSRDQTNHSFNATFNVGKSYRLTVGVIGGGGGMVEGATLDLRLYYRQGATNLVTVASRTLTHTSAVFSNTTHLIDCHLDLPPVKATDPWAGQHIGIEFKSTVTTNLQGGYWDLDNVRLVELMNEPAIVAPFLSNGQFNFGLLSEPGARFEIVATTNLLVPLSNWPSLGVLTNSSGSNIFTDTTGEVGARFYRARQLP